MYVPLFSCITKSSIRYYSVTIRGYNFIGKDNINPRLFFNKSIYNTIKFVNQTYHENKNYFYLSDPNYKTTFRSPNYRTYPLLMFTQLGTTIIRNNFQNRISNIKHDNIYFNTMFFISNDTKNLLSDLILNDKYSYYAKQNLLTSNILQNSDSSDRYVLVLSVSNFVFNDSNTYDFFKLFKKFIEQLSKNIQINEIKNNFLNVYNDIIKTIKSSEIKNIFEDEILQIKDNDDQRMDVDFHFLFSVFSKKIYYLFRISIPRDKQQKKQDNILFITELKNDKLYTSVFKKYHDQPIQNIVDNLKTKHDSKTIYQYIAKRTNLINKKLMINTSI